MSLTNLPAEILVSIIEAVLPADLARFACTCRRIHNLAARRLEIHRSLLKKPIIYGYDCSARDTMTSIIQSLCKLQRDPMPGHYVTVVHFKPAWRAVDDLPTKLDSCDLNLLLARCDWLESSGRHDWKAAIVAGDACAAFVLLLNSFPNLRRLLIESDFENDLFRSRLSELCRDTSKSSPSQRRPLAGLGLLLVGCPTYGRWIRLAHIEDLIFAPALKRFAGYKVLAHDIDNVSLVAEVGEPKRFSDLQEVEFNQSSITPARLLGFLTPMRRLRKLMYQDVKWLEIEDVEPYVREFESLACEWLNEHELSVETVEQPHAYAMVGSRVASRREKSESASPPVVSI